MEKTVFKKTKHAKKQSTGTEHKTASDKIMDACRSTMREVEAIIFLIKYLRLFPFPPPLDGGGI
ncbi:MAG: hypothetical protein MJ025_04685 [Victivallaceae bacterium]|nr:hypothetical protein [Victivallaceae bacterium]